MDNNNDDPNHNYRLLEESLIDSHNECFPTRVVKFNRKRHKISPWMTNGKLKSINQRNRLYKNLKQFKPDSFIYTENQLDFNRYRNELKKTITHAKRSYYKDLYKQYKFDVKKTWAVLSDILNRDTRNAVPDNMIINGLECSDKQACKCRPTSSNCSRHCPFGYALFFPAFGAIYRYGVHRHLGS